MQGHRCSSDLALLRLWHRLAAVAPVHPFATELPMCHTCGLKKKIMIISLMFNFCHFDYCLSQHVPPWVNPVWASLLPRLEEPMLGKFSALITSDIFQALSCFFWDPYNVSHFMLSLKLSSFLFILFSLPCSMAMISTALFFQLMYLFFCLMYYATDSF